MTDSGHDCSLKELLLLLSHALLCAQGRASEHSSTLPPHLPAALPEPVLIQEASRGRVVELLCRTPSGYAGILFKLYRERDLVNSTEFGQDAREARFSVVRERGARWKPYCCLYQNSDGVYSAFSSYLEPRDSTVPLPAPTLSFARQDPADRVLLCEGSPSYPGAEFLLLQLGSSHPLERQTAPPMLHSASFLVPADHQYLNEYQCQYSVLLDQRRRESERSPPLAVPIFTKTAMNTSTAAQPPAEEHTAPTDWPMIMGSISAVVLVMVVLTALGFVVRWKVKALVAERQKREEARFWHNFHAMDHVVDLTLRRVSVGSQEWDPVKDEKGSRTTGKCSSSSSDPHFYTFRNSMLR
ncbi:uncharacterized protein LOC108939937 [Scleropages formosus]|uniref:uncharacterized protein LOC108939937 n=1 Tax=Scleropages formosus TaxID=113540 RepID=UPI0010FABEA7|nr:uncharacterized protein LOC108939937 [Scleropages formosus]